MASNLFSNLSRKMSSTFFHLGSSVANSNDQEARRRIKEAAKNNLGELSLSGLGLTRVPPELGELTGLQSLNLSANQLQTLPSQFSQLRGLQRLYLGHNQFQKFPDELIRLPQLQWLDLKRNQLVTLFATRTWVAASARATEPKWHPHKRVTRRDEQSDSA